MKRCARCKVEKPISEFCKNKACKDGHAIYCRECSTRITRLWRQTPRGIAVVREATRRHKEKDRYRHVKRKYGLSAAEYDTLIASGRCEICGRSFSECEPCVDHDHVSGEIRGALCQHCNALLGYAKDNPDVLRKAADYLDQHTESNSGVTDSTSVG